MPKLLGYTRDSEGNLTVNPKEAPTVKLAFYMCLYGYSTQEIADTFNSLGRKSYLGNAYSCPPRARTHAALKWTCRPPKRTAGRWAGPRAPRHQGGLSARLCRHPPALGGVWPGRLPVRLPSRALERRWRST